MVDSTGAPVRVRPSTIPSTISPHSQPVDAFNLAAVLLCHGHNCHAGLHGLHRGSNLPVRTNST